MLGSLRLALLLDVPLVTHNITDYAGVTGLKLISENAGQE
jgi:hypothetical protein